MGRKVLFLMYIILVVLMAFLNPVISILLAIVGGGAIRLGGKK